MKTVKRLLAEDHKFTDERRDNELGSITERLKTAFVGLILVAALGLVVTWMHGGTPFPGRYQIVTKPGDAGIMMVDTATGKIRIFAVRRAGSGSYAELERRLEVFELTD